MIEYWVAGRPQCTGCLPCLGEGQGRVVDLCVGEVLRDGGDLQPPKPQSCCGDTFLSALMPRRVGRLLAAAEADFPPL